MIQWPAAREFNLTIKSVLPVAAAAMVVGALTALEPAGAIAVVGLVLLAVLPQIGHVAFLGLLLLVPVFNPSFAPTGESGRLYLSHFLIGIALVSTLLQVPFRLVDRRIVVAVICGAGYALISFAGSELPSAVAAAWAYRPLQFFLVLLIAWHWTRRAAGAEQLFLLGALIGTALAVVNVVSPVDLFAASRPADLPWRSLIGGYERAHGAFVYSNNLAQYAAYCGVFAVAVWLNPQPGRFRRLARWTAITCLLAIVAALSRAALGGFIIAIAVLVWKGGADMRIRASVFLLGVMGVLALLVLAEPGANNVLAARVADADAGFALRFRSWQDSWQEFQGSPIVGAGVSLSRLDSTYLLALLNAGVVGSLLLLGGGVALWQVTRGIDAWHRRACLSLALLFLSSGILQDNLGQTLSTWALAVSYVLIVRSGQRTGGQDLRR